ncbi:MAG: 30S ribosomal protein S12 methylthiotransferase RimO [Bacteroidales bacterium]
MQRSKINFVSLGCSKNTVDSESLAGKLIREGFSVEFNMKTSSFDFVIINTCGFIDKAKEESVNTILEFVNLRKKLHKNFKIIVYGCLAHRYREDLREELQEIDYLFGIMQDEEIIRTILSCKPYNMGIIPNYCTYTRKLSNAKHYAYIKISEGCDRKCSFCAIPLIKGKHISRKIEEIVDETNELIRQGVKEIILIGQDTSYYGLDLYGKRRLYDLLKALCCTNIHWIRLQYSYPNQFPMEILDLMNEQPKICHYLDMPLQHINDRILASMNRNITSNEIISLINTIRNKVNNIVFRTTLIVGYPSETLSEFKELKQFISKMQFDRMGAFTYSKEEGTRAAKLNDNITENEKQRRLDELTSIQQEISFNLNQQKIGKIFETIIDRKEGNYFIGRTMYDSPEVDNEVLVKVTENPTIKIGEFYNIQILDATEFDIYGRLAK